MDILAEQGTTVSLACSSLGARPWFFCVWEGPRGDRVCGLRTLDTENTGEDTRSLCGEETRLIIGGQMRYLSSQS